MGFSALPISSLHDPEPQHPLLERPSTQGMPSECLSMPPGWGLVFLSMHQGQDLGFLYTCPTSSLHMKDQEGARPEWVPGASGLSNR